MCSMPVNVFCRMVFCDMRWGCRRSMGGDRSLSFAPLAEKKGALPGRSLLRGKLL